MKQIFIDKKLEDEFHKNGFVIIDLFSDGEIHKIRNASLQLLSSFKSILPNRYFPVGQHANYQFRNQSTNLIKELVVPSIYKLFEKNSIDIHSGTHLVKPRGRNSFLQTHQDSSIVDENKYNAILFWCPLQNINLLNGQLYVLKRSHLLDNKYRSTTIPWKYRNVTNLIYKNSIPIKIKLGQICLFHSALIHHSGYNFTTKYRIAISSFITDKDAPLLNYMLNEEKNEIEVFEVEKDYYHNNDFNSKPFVLPNQVIPFHEEVLHPTDFENQLKALL